jgi:hypothetical protein
MDTNGTPRLRALASIHRVAARKRDDAADAATTPDDAADVMRLATQAHAAYAAWYDELQRHIATGGGL